MKKYIFLLFLVVFQLGLAQNIKVLKLKKYKVAVLSDSLRESSGLNFFQNQLYTFNDSGNTSDLFEIDKKSGKITRNIKTNLQNTDWEAITSDSTHIYIGDFGNNAGNRHDLKIYKIFADSLFASKNLKSLPGISFFYPEQKDFQSKNLNNNFDAEAMIYLNGNIHLFTKEWQSKSVSHYLINPNVLENQPAKKLENFRVGFVVTDASYYEKKLYLVGYTKQTEVFLTIFDETEPGIFFKNVPKKYYLGTALKVGQIEGIAVNKDGIFLSGEDFKTPIGEVKQSFYFIPKEKIK